MKKKIINGLLFAVALVAATSSFVSCKDYEGDNYAELNEKYSTLQDAFNAQVTAMKDYVLLTESGWTRSELAAMTIKERLAQLGIDCNNYTDDQINSLRTEIKDWTNDKLLSYYTKGEMDILLATNLDLAKGYTDTKLTEYKNEWESVWKEKLEKAIAEAAEVEANSANWNQAYEWVNAGHTDWDRIKELVDEKSSSWQQATKLVEKITSEYQEGWDVGGDTKAATIQDVIDYFKAAGTTYAGDIDALEESVSKILDAMKAEVTGIEIQSVTNPIYGSFAFPTGTESYVLAAYYGKFDKKVYFPAGDENEVWVDNAHPAVLSSELAAIGAKQEEFVKGTQMLDEMGNAGKVYMTINPSNFDFEGKDITLRTFNGQVSKVVLNKLTPSTADLNWGIQRRAEIDGNSAFGAYEAEAYISPDVVEDVALTFDMNGQKDTFKALLKNWDSASAVDFAKLGLAVLNGFQTKVPRLGINAQWKDEANNEWKNYLSKCDIAAVSIFPLGFDAPTGDSNFSGPFVKMKSKLTAKEWAYEREIENMIKIQLNLPETVQEKYKVVTEGGVRKVYIIVPASGGAPEQTIEVTALINAINEAIDKNISDVKSNLRGLVAKLIAKQNSIFDKVIAVASNPNRYFQPALLAANKDLGYFYPSRTHLAPTQVKKGNPISFYPTTLNAEILAPAYKKYVAITNAWKVEDIDQMEENQTIIDLNKDNSLNTVWNGPAYDLYHPFSVETENLKPGYVYEFVYECLGYNGKVAGKKYYIEIFE